MASPAEASWWLMVVSTDRRIEICLRVSNIGQDHDQGNGDTVVVLTDRRLIFLSQTFMGGPGKKVPGEVPREQVSLAEAKMGVVSLLRVAFGTPGDGVALTFPRVDKKNAESLAAALGQAPAA